MSTVKRNENDKINGKPNEKYSKDDAYKTLDMVNMWIGNVDAKISYSLTFIGVLLGFFLTTNKPINISQIIYKVFEKIKQISYKGLQQSMQGIELKDIMSVIILVLICIFIFTSVKACIYLYEGIKGRIDPVTYDENGLITKSNIFWSTIGKKKYIDFYNDISNLDETNLIKDISSQIFINSKVCTEKFQNYNKGIENIIISVIVFFIYTIIGYIFI